MCSVFSAIRTAIVYSAYGSRASYYDDWQDAFHTATAFATTPFNIARSGDRNNFITSVKQFDLIVLLHSVNANNLIYAQEILPALQSRNGRLLSFVGNELSLPGAPLAPKISFLKESGVELIATQLLKETGNYLYSGTGAQVVAIPHALNASAFQPKVRYENRTIDIGTRSFRYPSTFLGDDDRNRLLELFTENSFKIPLNIDIKTDQRLNRTEWGRFLNKCKGTVSNEAGGYWIDKDDATMEKVKVWLQRQPGGGALTIKSDSPLRRFAHKLPWAVRQWLIKIMSKGIIRHEALIGQDVDFDEVYELFYKSKPFPPKINGKCISSRHFDAAGTQTCQIMIIGRYNDILHADEHYIPIKPDFSDVALALEKFKDISYCKALVGHTYDYIMSEHTYAHRIRQIEKIVCSL